MNDWLSVILNSDHGPATDGGPMTIVFIMLLSFVIGHFIGFVYMWTHEAISYSRTFVASLAVIPILIGIMMVVMAGNALIAFGLLAVLGVIRFRNVLKDTRDTTFVLWAIMEGLTVGTLRYSTAFLGALGVAAALFYLRFTSFGTRQRYDAVLTARLRGDLQMAGAELKRVLDRHVSRARLTSEHRATDEGVDVSYQLLLRDPSRSDELQSELAAVGGLANVSVFLHDDEAEI